MEPTLHAGGPAELSPRTFADLELPGAEPIDQYRYNPWRAPGHAPIGDPWWVPARRRRCAAQHCGAMTFSHVDLCAPQWDCRRVDKTPAAEQRRRVPTGIQAGHGREQPPGPEEAGHLAGRWDSGGVVESGREPVSRAPVLCRESRVLTEPPAWFPQRRRLQLPPLPEGEEHHGRVLPADGAGASPAHTGHRLWHRQIQASAGRDQEPNHHPRRACQDRD